MTYKSSCLNNFLRSLCSVVCKWNYIIDESGSHGWPSDLLDLIGLTELLENHASLIGEFKPLRYHTR